MIRALVFVFLLQIFSPLYSAPLTIGVLPFNPPFTMSAGNGSFFGFDIDIMMDICKRMKTECRFVPVILSQILVELPQGKIDLAMGSLTITAERQQKFLFSLPYLASYGQFVGRKVGSIQQITDLLGKRVGVLKSSVFKDAGLRIFNNNVKIVEFNTVPNMIDALMHGDVEAVLFDEGAARYWTATNSMDIQLLGKPLREGMGYGILARKDQIDLIQRINQAILAMEGDGSYIKFYNRYFSPLKMEN